MRFANTGDAPLALAGVLHTETALELYDEGAPELGQAHLELATELVQRSTLVNHRGTVFAASFGPRWCLAAAMLLHGHGYYDRAARYVDMGLDTWSDDVSLLVERGALEEVWATVSAAEPGSLDAARRNSDDHLKRAERALQRALELDGSRTEAVIRLASVRITRGRYEEARASLERLDASEPTREFAYLVNLLLGALDERDGRLNHAVARYTAATNAYPMSQAARTALAAVLRRLNRPTDALAVVRESLAQEFAHGAADPWWAYYMGRLTSLDELVAWLRDEARR